MSAPKPISLIIDGKQCTGTAGQTILEIASANGVKIPTLCYMKELSPWGGCRICIVEIKGSPKIVPSCATPAQDGSEIIVNSDRLYKLRQTTLELLFSERNHICPICPSNKGDCDLQLQAYRHGMDHVRFPYLYPALPMDVSGKWFGLDHNRCILCTRCVRTCDEIEGTHTLDIANRGMRNQIVVDLHSTFGQSDTCTQCGACVANCPTGALFDKSQFYRGKLNTSDVVRTTCTECPVGCGLMVSTKEGRIIDVFGDNDSLNKGHLCVKGRYQSWAEPRQRIEQPMLRRDGKLVPVSWPEAIGFIKKQVAASPKWQNGLLASPRVTNETAQGIMKLANTFDRVGVRVARNEAAICVQPDPIKNGLEKIDAADCIILLGTRLGRDHGVLTARIRVAVRKNGAKLIVLHSSKSDLDNYADVSAPVVSLERAFWHKIKTLLGEAQRPVLVYGAAAMSAIGVTILERLINTLETKKTGESITVMAMPRSTNSFGLTAAGLETVEELSEWLENKPLHYLHLVASDEPDGGARWLEERHIGDLLNQIDCVVVQAAYPSALTERATVVLPSAIWCERNGTTTNFEGQNLPVRQILPTRGQARDDRAILEELFA
jgi:formate dehydrogenase major subunit